MKDDPPPRLENDEDNEDGDIENTMAEYVGKKESDTSFGRWRYKFKNTWEENEVLEPGSYAEVARNLVDHGDLDEDQIDNPGYLLNRDLMMLLGMNDGAHFDVEDDHKRMINLIDKTT